MDIILENWELIIPVIVSVASLLAAVLPDDSGVMKVVNWLALNVGKAKNDPDAQA